VSERAHAAVAIVTSPTSLLLLRRRESPSDHWSGHWCFPGGRRHSSDADLLDTALRELAEECALTLPRESLVQELPVGRAGSPERYVLVKPFVLGVPEEAPVVPQEAEMAEARWVRLADLRDPSRHALRVVPGQGDRLVPSFDLPPLPLWGFTYRVACDWLGV
jgi:8-oxo-dGTP pyrophosphatase MutT (NUDIX family)